MTPTNEYKRPVYSIIDQRQVEQQSRGEVKDLIQYFNSPVSPVQPSNQLNMEKRKVQIFDKSETAKALKGIKNRDPFRSHQSERSSNSEKNRQIIHPKPSARVRRPKKQIPTHFNHLENVENKAPSVSQQSGQSSNSEQQKWHIVQPSAYTVSMRLRQPRKQVCTHFNHLKNVKNTTPLVPHQSGQSSKAEQQKWHITKPKQSTPPLFHAFSMPSKPKKQDQRHFNHPLLQKRHITDPEKMEGSETRFLKKGYEVKELYFIAEEFKQITMNTGLLASKKIELLSSLLQRCLKVNKKLNESTRSSEPNALKSYIAYQKLVDTINVSGSSAATEYFKTLQSAIEKIPQEKVSRDPLFHFNKICELFDLHAVPIRWFKPYCSFTVLVKHFDSAISNSIDHIANITHMDPTKKLYEYAKILAKIKFIYCTLTADGINLKLDEWKSIECRFYNLVYKNDRSELERNINNVTYFDCDDFLKKVKKKKLNKKNIECFAQTLYLSSLEKIADISNAAIDKIFLEKKCGDIFKQLAEFSSNISKMVICLILSESLKDKRMLLLQLFIKAAKCCIKMGNFEVVHAIELGISNSAIARLNSTYKRLPISDRKELKKIKDIFVLGKNCQNYRKHLSTHSFPIPSTGILSKDLVFGDEGNKGVNKAEQTHKIFLSLCTTVYCAKIKLFVMKQRGEAINMIRDLKQKIDNKNYVFAHDDASYYSRSIKLEMS